MKIDINDSGNASAVIEAIARVYSSGLVASGYTNGAHRRREARDDVKDFLDMIKDMNQPANT
jgi:hypothetical protein